MESSEYWEAFMKLLKEDYIKAQALIWNCEGSRTKIKKYLKQYMEQVNVKKD